MYQVDYVSEKLKEAEAKTKEASCENCILYKKTISIFETHIQKK